MNSNKLSKHVKRKVTSNFNMGQTIEKVSNSVSVCSIFSDDEDVKFVVNNSDDSGFSTTVPIDKNIKLSHKTYSKRNPISYPGISPLNKESFQFSVVSKVEPLNSKALQHCAKAKIIPVKCKSNGTFTQSNSLNTDLSMKNKFVAETSFAQKPKESTNVEYVENDLSSDSDIEVIEIKVINPNALNLKPFKNSTRKLLHTQSSMEDHNRTEVIKKKRDVKPLLQTVTKSTFTSDAKLSVNKANTASYVPNNRKVFSNVHSCVLDREKMLKENSNLEVFSTNNHNSMVKSSKSSSKTADIIPDVSKNKRSKRELKNLYENLNEISWTQDTSFKNLLRNPDYIRHSERSTGRIAGTGKTLRKAKQMALQNANKTARLKKTTLLMKSTLRKNKFEKLGPNETLKGFNNKVISPKISKLTKSSKSQEMNGKNKMKKSNSKLKSPKLNANFDSLVKTKLEANLEKMSRLKTIKRHTSDNKTKMKEKVEISKVKSGHNVKPAAIFKENSKMMTKPKVEISEASSSGINNGYCPDTYSCNSFQDSKAGNIKKIIQQESFDSKCVEMIHQYKKEHSMYAAAQNGSDCRVQIEPLEHTNLWNTEYYEDFRKQFLQQALRKAMEKREPNCVAAMLKELCDSYLSPNTEENKLSKKKRVEEESLRSSARQIEGAFRYKEIVVKKHQNYMQVILVPNGVKKNCLSIDAIKELRDAFLLAKKDPKCRAVLLNSSGSYFCTGLDLSQLIGSNKKQACEEMATVVRELVLVLGSFTKPVVAAVNGAALGFGVALLAYCDVVLASDKATFCVPSTTIGYMPEGGLTLTLPQIMGNVRSSEMLLQGTRLTASQAHQKGLVSEVLWPSRFMNEVMPRLLSIITQPLQVMEATKLLVRANVWDKLRSHMDFERRLLVNQWLSAACQDNIKRILRLDSLID